MIIKKRLALGAKQSVSVVAGGAVPARYGGPLSCAFTSYIINADDLIVSRAAPVQPSENEIVARSMG